MFVQHACVVHFVRMFLNCLCAAVRLHVVSGSRHLAYTPYFQKGWTRLLPLVSSHISLYTWLSCPPAARAETHIPYTQLRLHKNALTVPTLKTFYTFSILYLHPLVCNKARLLKSSYSCLQLHVYIFPCTVCYRISDVQNQEVAAYNKKIFFSTE